MAYKAADYARTVYADLRAEAEAEGRELTRYVPRVRAIVAAEQPDLAPFLLANDKNFRRQLNNTDFKARKVRGRPRRRPSKSAA